MYNVHAVLQSSSFPILQFPVFQFTSFPDPVRVGVGVWSSFLETHSGEFLGGCRGVRCWRPRGSLPPRRSPWRLSSPILFRLCAPVRHLGTKMPQHRSRYSKKHHLGGNIFQHSSRKPTKTASRSLQRRFQPLKTFPKHSKTFKNHWFFNVFCYLAFRVQDPKKLPRCLPKCTQVGRLGLQVGHLGSILAPSCAT